MSVKHTTSHKCRIRSHTDNNPRMATYVGQRWLTTQGAVRRTASPELTCASALHCTNWEASNGERITSGLAAPAVIQMGSIRLDGVYRRHFCVASICITGAAA